AGADTRQVERSPGPQRERWDQLAPFGCCPLPPRVLLRPQIAGRLEARQREVRPVVGFGHDQADAAALCSVEIEVGVRARGSVARRLQDVVRGGAITDRVRDLDRPVAPYGD